MITRMVITLLSLLIFATGHTSEKIAMGQGSDAAKLELATVVTKSLRQGHRGGSLIYKGACTFDSQIKEIYPLEPPVTIAPMNMALNEVVRKYPTFSWIDFGENAVRVIDNSTKADVLNLHVKHFKLEQVVN